MTEEILRASGTETVQVLMTLPKLPDGYEYTGEVACLSKSDYYVGIDGMVLRWEFEGDAGAPLPIIRKTRQFPEALKKLLAPGWVTTDESGDIYWWIEEPEWNAVMGYWESKYTFGTELDDTAFPCLEGLPRGSKAIWKVGNHKDQATPVG